MGPACHPTLSFRRRPNSGADNVIPAKAGIEAPGLFLALKTTPDKTHVVPVERVPGKTGKWNPGPRFRHMNHAGHRRGASGFRPSPESSMSQGTPQRMKVPPSAWPGREPTPALSWQSRMSRLHWETTKDENAFASVGEG